MNIWREIKLLLHSMNEDKEKEKVFDIDTFSCFVKLQVKIVLKKRKETIFEYT